MTKSGKPVREFWIKHIEDNINGSGDRVFRQFAGTDAIHVIEYAAYDQLLTEVESLRASLREAIEALEKTPCTGNGDVHLLSCFKCSQIDKLRERHGELKGMG